MIDIWYIATSIIGDMYRSMYRAMKPLRTTYVATYTAMPSTSRARSVRSDTR